MPLQTFRSGRLTVGYEHGSLRYLRVGDTEVLRRIYFAVRDAQWTTIPYRIIREDVSSHIDEFDISFDAEHREGPVVFGWRGTIRGRGDRIDFLVDGRAESRFLKNRIGICVLHPGRGGAGLACRVEHSDGSVTDGVFPEFVSPTQPFFDVRSISHEAVPGVTAKVSLWGDEFETEDQRNWTDGSFKTYSTALAHPFPVEVEPGFGVRQAVVVEVSGEAAVVVRVDEGLTVPWPSVGRSRVDLDLRDAAWQSRLAGLSGPVEVAVHAASAGELGAVREACAGLEVSRWIVYGVDVPAAREVLGGEVGTGRVGGNFAELNRNREAVAGADFAVFRVNSQVHDVDALTVAETLEGQVDAVRSALQFAPRIAVSPVELPIGFDGAFVAAWVVGSLSAMSAGGASSVTYSGVEAGSPVETVLKVIEEFAPESVVPCEVSDPLRVSALVLANGDQRRVLLGNLTEEPVLVRVAEPYGLELPVGPHDVVQVSR